MNIRSKLFLSVAAPGAMICVLGWYAAQASERAILDVAHRTSVARAEAMMGELEHMILARLSTWERYAQSFTLREALEASNQQFELAANREELIDERDALWRAHSESQPFELISELYTSELSRELGAFAHHWEPDHDYLVFPEVFVTNRFGANLALTNTTSDYRQNDETWWVEALEQGTYLTPLEYDESSRVFSTSFCMRIDAPSGEPLGVLKVVFDTKEIFDTFRERATSDEGETLALTLLDEHNRVLFSTSETVKSATASIHETSSDSESLFPLEKMGKRRGHFKLNAGPFAEKPAICAYARAYKHLNLPSSDLTLILERDEGTVLAPARALRRDLLLFAGVAALLGLLLATLGSVSIFRRFTLLTASARRVGCGERGVQIEQASSNDELDQVILAFNRMSASIDEQAGELHLRNAELETEVGGRKSLESQLIQAEKMRSIGQLAAGIAHEINTPTQYVGDNTRFLEECFRDIEPILQQAALLASSAKDNVDLATLASDLIAALEKADVEYLKAEIPSAIQQSLNGIDRVRTIVRSMKDFSHPGGDEMSPMDLNRAIESTTLVASNEWKYVADLKTEFDSELPRITCFPGQINQVVLNMIVNASHAIQDAVGSDSKGLITISTSRVGEFAEIRITDTGTGMPEEVRARIFDPFYTTKEVGKGTGQGLSMAHGVIVNSHGGEILVDSEVGVGTTFTIRLPLRPAPEPSPV